MRSEGRREIILNAALSLKLIQCLECEGRGKGGREGEREEKIKEGRKEGREGGWVGGNQNGKGTCIYPAPTLCHAL